MNRMPEADWKIFKKHHLEVHEKFVNRALSQISEVMHGDTRSRIEVFQDIADLVRRLAKQQDQLFSDYRRSTAALMLRIWIHEGLMSEDKVKQYSDEVRAFLSLK